jgi:hypothetical protein
VILTEAEALTKWCPFSRVAFMDGNCNRISSERLRFAKAEAERTGDDRDWKYYCAKLPDTHCIGSLCMAWRAADPAKHGPCDPNGGYCGLAGEP